MRGRENALRCWGVLTLESYQPLASEAFLKKFHHETGVALAPNFLICLTLLVPEAIRLRVLSVHNELKQGSRIRAGDDVSSGAAI